MLFAAPRAVIDAGPLLFYFDDVPPYYLDCLVTLRREVCPGFRLVECHRVFQAVPLDDRYTLGSRRTLISGADLFDDLA